MLLPYCSPGVRDLIHGLNSFPLFFIPFLSKKDSLRKTVFSNEDVFCLFLNVVEAVHALVFSDWTQFILNADQLVVLRDTVSTAH